MARLLTLEKYKQHSDAELVTIFRAGDDNAAVALINRYLILLKTTIGKLIYDKATQEDMLQDLMEKVIKVLRTEEKYTEEGTFGAWVKRVCHNMCIDFLRKEKIHIKSSLDSDPYISNKVFSSDKTQEQTMIREEEHAKLWRCINLLSPDFRDMIIFRYFYEIPFHEIAELKGMNINTTVGRMHYAHKKLFELMKEQ